MIESILKDMAEGALKRQGTVRAVDIEAQKTQGQEGTGPHLDCLEYGIT